MVLRLQELEVKLLRGHPFLYLTNIPVPTKHYKNGEFIFGKMECDHKNRVNHFHLHLLFRLIRTCSINRVQLFAILWTVAHHAPLSMGFPRQEYCSGLPLLSPGDLPDPGIQPGSPALQADSLPTEPPGKPLNFFTAFILILR